MIKTSYISHGFLFIILIVLLAGCKKEGQPVAPLVQLEEVKADGETETISMPGRTCAGKKQEVSFRVSGTIAKVLVKPGDYVRAGQAVAVLDKRDYETQLTATKAEYAQVKAEVERVMAMHEDKAVTDNDYDKARYGIQQMTQKLKHHTDQVNDCVIYAPFDGYVEEVYHTGGSSVLMGMPVVSVFSDGGVEVEIHLPASLYQKRDCFASFSAKLAAMPGREFRLRQNGISHHANANQLYEMRLAFDTTLPDITPGMTVMVDINCSREENRNTVVPVNALIKKGGRSNVMVYDAKNGCVRLRAVSIATLRHEGNAVISSGLSAGEKVVSAGAELLTDGEKVRPGTEVR